MKTKALVAAIAALATALPAAAAVETFTIDSRHTFPAFEVSHFGMSIQRGRFNKTSGKITVDREAKTGSVDVTIDAASVDTGEPKLGDHLRAADFFNASAHPTITFKGTKFNFEGDKVKTVDGELTMLGTTKPVTLTAQHFNCGNHPMNKKVMCGAEFTTTIKRSDWGMKYAVPAVADDVLLRINVEAFKD
jgi:polyisoprenoid-binding protein YceI